METRRFLRGDALGIDQGLYRRPLLSRVHAERIVESLRLAFQTPPVVIKTGRRTRRRRGATQTHRDEMGWIVRYTITLHPIGWNVGTLLHEFAHVVDPKRGHSRTFKAAQRAVIQRWWADEPA